MENKTRLIIVDDEAQICELMEYHFKKRGYDVFIATSGKQAIDLVKKNSPQLMLIDKRMPDMDGIQTLESIRQFNTELKVIFISGESLDSETETKIKGLNVAGYLDKPVTIENLDEAVAKAVLAGKGTGLPQGSPGINFRRNLA